MNRREFFVEVAAATALPVAAWMGTARAQSGRVLIGVLDTSPRERNRNFAALIPALRQYGYAEGENLAFAYRSADGRNESFPALASELVGLKVDIIVTRGTPAALAAKAATATIPVIMAAAGDPLAIAGGTARPAANLTGFGGYVRGTEAKRVELLRDMLPKLVRIAAFMNLSNPSRQAEWRAIAAGARDLSVEAQVLDTRTPADIARSFDAASRGGADAVVIGSDTIMQTNQAQVIALAEAHRMPAVYTFRDFVEAGGLVSYGVSLPDLYRRAAGYVGQILKGNNPRALPIAEAERAELVVNKAAAAAIGLALPPAVVARADEVIG